MTPIQMLLDCLSDGDFHSGEEIAELLNVSRTAIWKQIKKLNPLISEDIVSVPGKGYQWQHPFVVLDKDKILCALSNENKNVIDHLEVLFECTSTNQILLENNKKKFSDTVLLLTESQTEGRGRRGRSWVSPIGCNLYMSLAWESMHSVAEMSGLSLVVAVSVANAIKKHGVKQVKLKWPNDIYVEEKKLAGVLLELRGESNSPCRAVIGIGVNINMPTALGNSIDQPWIDMQKIMGQPIDRNKVAASIVDELLSNMKIFEEKSFSAFVECWDSFDLLKDKKINVTGHTVVASGIARGVDNQGALLLESENKIQAIYSGEVSIRLE